MRLKKTISLLKTEIKTHLKPILICLIALWLLNKIFGSICPLKIVIGLPCPGCGLTRATLSLFSLNFKQAFFFNPLIFPLALLFLAFFVLKFILFKSVEPLKKYAIILLLLSFFLYFCRMRVMFPQTPPLDYHEKNLTHTLIKEIKEKL